MEGFCICLSFVVTIVLKPQLKGIPHLWEAMRKGQVCKELESRSHPSLQNCPAGSTDSKSAH